VTPSTDTTNVASESALRNYLYVPSDEGDTAKDSPHRFKATAKSTAGRFDFFVGTFAPRTGPPLHYHVHQDDTWYVLDGVLTMQVGDDVFDIGPGDFVSIPPRVAHTFDNLHNGDAAVRAVNVMTPGGLFEMFDEMADVPAGPNQSAALSEVAAGHGTLIVGPTLRVTLGLE
jgi:mannose-6-phosphate isomerase-like protein (cupin superfamily)